MNKNLLSNLTNCISKYKDKIKYRNVFIVLALVVVFGTLYIFMQPAITMNEELICEITEHTHTDACYEEKFICEESDENKENEDCYEKELVCEETIHMHDETCYGTLSDKESIVYLTNIIDGLPTVDEMNSHIDSLSTEEEKNEYSEEVIATATNAYAYYLKLEEKVQTKITNIDKLLEYEEENLIEVPEETSNEVALFDTYTGYNIATVASNGITDDGIVNGTDTSNIIKINLYDYYTGDAYIEDDDYYIGGSSSVSGVTELDVNYKFKNESNKYPGFHQSHGPYETVITNSNLRNWRFNFGDLVTTDREFAVTDKSIMEPVGTINEEVKENKPWRGYIKNTLGSDGYPAIKDGDLSLQYLFNQDAGGYARKQNNGNINGLFQYDSATATYHFDSRKNFAQFNPIDDTFTLYKQLITPNFMIYPFGNFLPLNNIRTQTTQASTINKAYFDTMVASATAKSKDSATYGGMTKHYGLVASRMSEWVNVMTIRNNNNDNWDAGFVATQYFELSGLPTPIETESLVNYYNIDFDTPVNFFFGLDMEMTFIQPKDGEIVVTDEETGVTTKNPMIFEFSGDDDVYVYIDGILFLDLSGKHRHVSGTINFDNGMVYYYALDPETGDTTGDPYDEVSFADILAAAGDDIEKPELNADGTFKNYSSHSFKFYYMERGAGSSVMKMNFNFPLIQENSIMVTKELDMNDAVLLGNPDFSFQILAANEDGTKTENTFIPVGTKYDILDTTGKKVSEGVVKENGIFTLKADQTAVFSGIEEDSGKYYVREILDESWVLQYDGITVDGKSTTVNNDLEYNAEFVGYESDVKDISDGHTSFVYNNSVSTNKSGELKIEKELESNYPISNPDKEFKFLVTLDGVKLKTGTSYNVTGADGTVSSKTVSDTEEGIIVLKVGEVASITGLFAGSKFEVTEEVAPLSGYQISYKVDGQESDGSSAIGYINDSSVSVLVTNIESGEELTIPIYKTISNPDGENSSFEFDLVEIVSYDDETPVSGGEEATTSITPNIEGDKIGQGESSFKIKYTQSDYEDGVTQKYYYKITERNPGGNSIRYDSRIYIIEVTISNTEEAFTASISKIWIDGVEKELQDIEFVNQILTKLTITKEVKGIVTGDALFDFRVKIKVNDVPLEGEYDYKLGTSTGKVTFTEGVATIKQRDSDTFGPVQLKDKESITIYLPYAATYKVTELTTDGFAVEYQVNSEDIQVGSGMESYVSLEKDDNNVKFINISGYELPDTGSSGRLIMVIIGLLLTIWFPVIHIGYMFNKRS